MRAIVVGHGRLGRLIERAAIEAGHEVAAVLTSAGNRSGAGITASICEGADVAFEVTRADSVIDNLAALARHGVNVVIGTTGWHAREAEAREIVGRHGIGVVASANFSLGANLLAVLAEQAAAVLKAHDAYGAFVHEQHHAAKRDAPSGTALMLRASMERAGFARPIDVSATRAGSIPGTHVVGFDGPAETLTLGHVVRDRATFAHGALAAARWLAGRRGWFTMRDVLGL
jgi:4-hydroxy-tetrahydrodipicolinate reductase